MYKIINFYNSNLLEEKDCYARGRFCWTCFPFAFFSPSVERFWKNKPTEGMNINEFNPENEKDDPVNGTKADSFLAINAYKRRPVLLLSSKCQQYDPTGLHGGEYFLVAPLRSVRILETNEYKHKPEFIWNTIIYKYDSLFFLPDSDNGNIRESIILFERITTLHQSWLTPIKSIMLSKDALVCVDMWLRNFIYGSIPKLFDEELEKYKTLMGEDPEIKRGIMGMGKYLKKSKN